VTGIGSLSSTAARLGEPDAEHDEAVDRIGERPTGRDESQRPTASSPRGSRQGSVRAGRSVVRWGAGW
jgi:hypothetical protein